MPVNRGLVATGVAAAGVVGVGIAATQFGGESGPETGGASTTAPVEATTPTTIEAVKANELIDNIFNNPNGVWECMDEGLATDTMHTVEVKNDQGEVVDTLVGQVMLRNLDVDGDVRSDDFRMWSDALSSPVVADLSDKQAVADNIYASWCNEPQLLAPVLIETANGKLGDLTIGEHVEWLEPYVGMTLEDADAVADSLTVPTTDQVTEEEFARNAARVELAEKMANAFQNMQNHGVAMDQNIVDSIALALPEMLDTDADLKLVRSGAYIGDVILFGITEKGEDCDVWTVGFNVDGKRPVVVEQDEDCDTPETTTTTTTTSTTTTTNPTTTSSTTTTTTSTPPTTGTTPPTTEVCEDTEEDPCDKDDDGELPGDPEVPADGDGGTPDVPGSGPAGQPVSPDGTVSGETLPEPQVTTTTRATTTTAAPSTTQAPASTAPAPTSTSAPVTQPNPSTLPPTTITVQPTRP